MNKALGYLALFFILGGLCLGIVALATNNWAENGDQTKGLFQSCRKHSCQNDSGYKEVLCSNNLDDDHKDEYKDDGKFQITKNDIVINLVENFVIF